MWGLAAVKLDLPYLYRQRDRKGRWLYYVRRKGRKTRLRGSPGSQAFLTAYNDALEIEPEKETAGAPGSLKWLCDRYKDSADFRQLSPRTQRVRSNILDGICAMPWQDAKGKPPAGTLSFAQMRKRHVFTIRDAATGGPEAANARVKALRQVFDWAETVGHVEDSPAKKVPYIKSKSEGFRPWVMEEVERYTEYYPLGTREYLALALLLYTGAARSDAVRLGRGMEKAGELHFRRTKTGVDATVPILPPLKEAIDACPSGHMTYLVTTFGKPFTANGFGNWFRRKCVKAGVPGRAHGLRKLGATILADNGASAHQLMAVFGWDTLKQAEVYTRAADRRKNARAGMANWPTGVANKTSSA